MRWQTKSRLFRMFDRVPFGRQLHYLAQRHVTRQWPRPGNLLAALAGVAEDQLAAFRRHSAVPVEEATFLEIGAGRDLTVALSLRMLGVRRVECVDLERLARIDLVNDAGRRIAPRFAYDFPSFADFAALAEWGVVYRAPLDAVTIASRPGAFDCFVSNEVLEHVPPRGLKAIMDAARVFLNQKGLMIHNTDYSDHYARSDPSISRFNFLRFGEAQWAKHNSSFQYVNRMRHVDYVRMFEACDFEIVESDVHRVDIPADVAADLDQSFSGYSLAELAALRSRLVLRRAS